MKAINFKLIELPKHQVLITKDFDSEDEQDKALLTITFFLDGVKVIKTLGYSDENKRDKDFKDFNEEFAQQVVDAISFTLITDREIPKLKNV